MEKATLKLTFLVALLVFVSWFSENTEARATIKEHKPVQCERPNDCISLCHDCTVNKCTAGLCVCECANKKSADEAVTSGLPLSAEKQDEVVMDIDLGCDYGFQCKHICPPGCDIGVCLEGHCACTCN